MPKLKFRSTPDYRRKRKIELARMSRNRISDWIHALEDRVFVITGQRPPGWYAMDRRQVTRPNNLSSKERNRMSAARSRDRRRKYIRELEAMCLGDQHCVWDVVMINNATNNCFFLNDTEILRI